MEAPTDLSSDFFTPSQVAAYLRVTPNTVRMWISEGRMPALRTAAGRGGRLLVRREDVLSVLTSTTPKKAAEKSL